MTFQRIGRDLPEPMDYPNDGIRRVMDRISRRRALGRKFEWPALMPAPKTPPASGRPSGKGPESITHSGKE